MNTANVSNATRKPTLATRMVTHGATAGPLAMLDGIVYEARTAGGYHRARDQRKARERFRRLAGGARECERVAADVARRAMPMPTPATAERETPRYAVAGDAGRVRDFIAWYARQRAAGTTPTLKI